MQPLSSYYDSDNALHATMTPREIVVELDKHIIGQEDAKRAVAIALRNRWRRLQLPPELAKEVSPKNILMIGPTGVGKTEIARRLAALTKAPFIKVEATKFTEVGYVGRDVESIIRDLMELAIKMINDEETKKVNSRAEEAAEEKILDCILTPSEGPEKEEDKVARQLFREKLRDGQLDEKEIEMEVKASVDVEIMAPPGMEDMISQMQSAFQNLAGERKKRRTLKVKDALKQAREEIADSLVNRDIVIKKAIVAVEEKAIIFIDEIDKITAERKYGGGAGVSREGVQRDLLPLVEGCTVSTKYGMVKTDHILFITSGSFHLSKPSDLIPELQGRLPIRVELKPLTKDDFSRILTEPHASLITQYKALLETEGFNLDFASDGIQRIAEIAYQVNERSENIGARRLYTILERTLETVSFEATDKNGESLAVTAEYVDQQISKLVKDEDLSDYIL